MDNDLTHFGVIGMKWGHEEVKSSSIDYLEEQNRTKPKEPKFDKLKVLVLKPMQRPRKI